MRTVQRNPVVDQLRGVAILLVLGLHLFGLWAHLHGGEDALRGIHRLFGHGYLGVNAFFAVSGYLIASTSVARTADGRVRVEAAPFYVRRATRILPLLLAVVALGAAALAVAPPGPSRDYLFDMPGTSFGGWFWASVLGFAFNWYRLAVTDGGVHGWLGLQWDVLWSLAVEEQFYVTFPALVLLCGTVRRMRAALWCVLAVAVATRVGLTTSGADWLTAATNSVSCFDGLALGVLTALSDPLPRRAARAAAIAGVALFAACYALGTLGAGLPATGVAAATSLLILSSRTPGAYRVPTLAPLARVGVLSYGLYLSQGIGFALVPARALELDPFVALAVAVPVCVALAWGSFELFERPVERTLRRAALGRLAARSARRTADSASGAG